MFNSNKMIMILVLCLFVIGMWFRIDWRADREYWVDEVRQVEQLKKPFLQLQKAVWHQFPGDYIMLWPVLRIFGDNKWPLSMPHLAFTILGYWCLFKLCRQYFQTIWGYLIVFLVFSFNYELIFHALEIRPYTVLVTLALFTYFIWDYVFQRVEFTLRQRIWIIMALGLIMLFHLYGIVMIFFQYIYFLTKSILQRKRSWSVVLEHIKCFWPLVFFLYVWASCVHDVPVKVFRLDTFAYVEPNLKSLLSMVIGNLIGYKPFYFTLIAIPAALLLPHPKRAEQWLFLLIMIVFPVIAVFLQCYYFHYWFLPRLFIWVTPLFIFWLGWCWDSVIGFILNKK